MVAVVELNLLRRMLIQPVRRIIRLTLGLPLLQEHQIVRGFNVILTEARDEGNYIFHIVRPYLNYVYRNWVAPHWRRSRMCVFGSAQRTNNVCESHNRMIREKVGTHPNVYTFIGSYC